VTLASTFGTLSGVVSDDKGPAAGIQITIKDAQNRGVIFMTRSKADGSYSSPRLAPGKYRMLVLDDDASSQALNDPAMEDFDEAFEIGPNQTVTRDLKLHPVTGKLE
jgi:Carboxypeptidase regulatory-like domain